MNTRTRLIYLFGLLLSLGSGAQHATALPRNYAAVAAAVDAHPVNQQAILDALWRPEDPISFILALTHRVYADMRRAEAASAAGHGDQAENILNEIGTYVRVGQALFEAVRDVRGGDWGPRVQGRDQSSILVGAPFIQGNVRLQLALSFDHIDGFRLWKGDEILIGENPADPNHVPVLGAHGRPRRFQVGPNL